MEKNNGRRSFIKHSSMGGLALLSGSSILYAFSPKSEIDNIKLEMNDTILFQGDSITDMRRNRKEKRPNINYGLGTGYAFEAASKLMYQYPGSKFTIYNRGIGGNKVYQLADRWEEDCLAIKPDVLSILVGVNDFWHTISIHYSGTVKKYKNDYKQLLQSTKDRLPDVKLIIGEPYALKGVKVVNDDWYPVFNDYRAAAKEIAHEFNAVFIPYQHIFDEALKLAPASYWSVDGVHPSVAGAYLMAQAWLKAVKV